MTFSEKLVLLRKEKGFSQEELAEILDVSRQSVSKWESGQSLPDYTKLINLSNLFNVSTDYLLKDQITEKEVVYKKTVDTEKKEEKSITLKEATAFLEERQKSAKIISYGVFLCIISPIWVITFVGLSAEGMFGFTDNFAIGVGISLCLAFVAVAVGLFIYSNSENSPYNFLKNEIFSLDSETFQVIRYEKENYKMINKKNLMLGVCFCILSSVPILLSIALADKQSSIVTLMVSCTLLIVAIGVRILVKNNINKESYVILLQEDSYSIEKKKIRPIVNTLTSFYWLLSVMIYLCISFLFDNWETSWLIIVTAAILYSALLPIIEKYLIKKDTD